MMHGSRNGTEPYVVRVRHSPDTRFGRFALLESFAASLRGPKRAREIARRLKHHDLPDEAAELAADRIALWRGALPEYRIAAITAGRSSL
jgi:hypothetical protein